MQRQNWNKNWLFVRGIHDLMDMLHGVGAESTTVDLPHDALLALGRDPGAKSGPSMAYFVTDNFQYEKTFFVAEAEKDQVHYLNFQAIYLNAAIFVNDAFVVRHADGYSPFLVRIDGYLKYGQENKVRVEVRSGAVPNGRWYPGSGIYRDVTLWQGGLLHIAPQGLHLTTVECDPELAMLTADTRLVNAGHLPRAGKLELTVRDAAGNVAVARTVSYYVKGNDTTTMHTRLEVPAPQLWDLDAPHLYTCEARLLEDGACVDSDCARFGIRTLRLDAQHGLRLNGRTVQLKGGCVHHDNGPLGSADHASAEFRRVRLLKQAGYNAIRTSHNPASPHMLDACDELGMLVMEELTDAWGKAKRDFDVGVYMPECWEEDIENLVARDYNHPCIVMWSIGNEIMDTGNTLAAQFGRKLAGKFRALDPTRYVTSATNLMCSIIGSSENIARMGELLAGTEDDDAAGGSDLNDLLNLTAMRDRFSRSDAVLETVEESCDMLDIVGLNYATPAHTRGHEKHPGWIICGSETSPDALDVNWALMQEHPYIIGDFSWTAWDYLGEVGLGRESLIEEDGDAFMAPYPWICGYCGDFDLSGYRRPISYWREIIWGGRAHKPYIAVHRPNGYGKEHFYGIWSWTDTIRSWTWPGDEGKVTGVEVYSDAEEVELLLDGRSLGRKPVGNDYKQFYCCWDVPYAAGTLEAVAYIGGQEVGRDTLATAANAALTIASDAKTLRAGSGQLAYIEIEKRDAAGTLDMTADDLLTVQVDGPARLIGCGSGDPRTTENYTQPTHKLFEGRLLAVVQAGEAAGAVTVRAGDVSLTLQVEG